MRGRYASYLMIAMAAQMVAINVVFVLMGCGKLTFEPWTGRTFVMAVYIEVIALIHIVVKYLFAPSGSEMLRLAASLDLEKTDA